jgi:hypothetical protein
MSDSPRPISRPRVSMGGFAEYVGASASSKLDCVQRQLRNYQASYRPGSDFYKDFVDALRLGRRDGTDELSLQRCISRQSQTNRISHYTELRRHWLAMSELHLPIELPDRAAWQTPGLTVGVTPELVLIRREQKLVTKLWLRQPELTPDVIKALHWLLLSHMEQLCPGGVPAVLDLRRRKLHVLGRRGFRRGYPELLAYEAASMGQLMHRLAQTA